MNTNKNISKLAFTISSLTKLIGSEITAVSGDATMFSWSDNEGYWFHLHVDKETGKLSATIDDIVFGNEKEMYAVIGYCQYHSIEHKGVGQ